MDSSGKCEGMLDCPFKGTMGSIAGTRVRSSRVVGRRDRKSTRLNSSHSQISYAVFCLKKKNFNAIEISKKLNRHPELLMRIGLHSRPLNQITHLNEQAKFASVSINISQLTLNCGDA